MEENKLYNALEWPNGIDRVEAEMLPFLPDVKEVKDLFMTDVLQWMIQW